MLKALILRSNVYVLTLAATVMVVLASMALTTTIRMLQFGNVVPKDLLMSFLVPTLVAPGFLFTLIRLILRQEALKAELEDRTQALEESHTQISRLLSHVKQAIFSVDADLRIRGACSQSCTDIFGGAPSGREVIELLCPDDTAAAESMRGCLQDALAEPDLRRKAIFTSLAPAECRRGVRVLRPEIVPLSQGFLFVVTDITEHRALEQRIEREQQRLELVLSALKGSDEFFALVDDFEAFIRQGQLAWTGSLHSPAPDALQAAPGAGSGPDLAALYRCVHTFKGSMLHLGFHHLPRALHAAEDTLRGHAKWAQPARQQALEQVFATDWAALLAADLAPVSEVLGQDFLRQRIAVTLEPHEVELIEHLVQEHLSLHPDAPPAVRGLARLRRIHLQEELRGHDRALQRVARDLGKVLNPLQVDGASLVLDANHWRAWVNALVHLFRNAIDHGIEDPDTREEQAKPHAGTLARCDAPWSARATISR